MRAEYDREAAVAYARRWALGRNPRFGDFSALGGDCANFASQCLWAGWGDMTEGWHYRSMNERTPSWSGVSPNPEGTRRGGLFRERKHLDLRRQGRADDFHHVVAASALCPSARSAIS